MAKIGVLGGSALYKIEDLKVTKRVKVKTPFGDPSDEFIVGKLCGKDVIFMPRHGRDHSFLPSEVNYRANIYGFKVLGVDAIVSISAVGSLKEDIKPLDVLLVDQFIDRTNHAREMTFFGDGIVAHVPMAEPVCKELRNIIYSSNKKLNVTMHNGGTYLNMEGPAFSTKAESFLYKSWGADVIGMTNLPEARLAREAGMCYASIAMITDYDCWYVGGDVDTVSADMVMQNLTKNVENAKRILKNFVQAVPDKLSCHCNEALKNSIVTRKGAVPKSTLKKLKPILEGFI